MKLRLIRSATLRLEYAGRQLLIDPDLAPQHARPPLRGKSQNPLVGLPCTPEEAIAGSELLIVSHLHMDHFDTVAQELLPKDLPLLCQPGDEERLRGKGFEQVMVVEKQIEWGGIRITRTDGHHGSGEVLGLMGKAAGFIFEAEGEPTIYWAGDTILYDRVYEVIAQARPDIIVTHSCGAVWAEPPVLIVMDAVQTAEVCSIAPDSKVIAVHMEAFDHSTVTRADLRHYAESAGVTAEQLLIPADGETLIF